MNSVMDVKCSLLNELHNICKKNNIKYIVGGKETLSYYKKGFIDDNLDGINVYMTYNDFVKFKNIIEQETKDRYIEYFLNDMERVNFANRFGNDNTTSINLRQLRKHNKNGIYITISIFNKPIKRKFKRKFMKLLTEFWFAKNRGINSSRIGLKKIIGNIAYVFTKIFGEKNIAKFIYNFKVKNKYITKWEDIEQRSSIICEKKKIKSKIFSEIEEINCGEYSFNIVKDRNTFLKSIYGSKFEAQKLPMKKKNDWLIEDTIVPYKKSLDMIKENGLLNDYYESLDKQLITVEKNYKNEKEIKKAWQTFLMSKRWIDLQDIYRSDKNELKKSIEEGDYEIVKEKLKPFFKSEKEWIKKEIPYVPIRKIDDIGEIIDKLER